MAKGVREGTEPETSAPASSEIAGPEADQESTQNNKKQKKKPKKHEHQQKEPTGEGKAGNSSIYVSGLPDDITLKEFVDYFSQCGIIKEDPDTNIPKAKIYLNEQGIPKGDVLIIYLKPPSVDLAIQLLDETEIRPGHKIKIEPASFSHKPAEAADPHQQAGPNQQQQQQQHLSDKNFKPISKNTKKKRQEKYA